MTGRAGLVLAALTLGTILAGTDGRAADPPAVTPAAPAGADSCAACHLETGDDRLAAPVKRYAGDIHQAKGFSCAACHGGDPRQAGMEAMDPARGYIGVPARAQVAQVCGRCHSDARFMRQYNPALRVDQVAEYATSEHGRRLREHGDAKVATCVSCHTPHAIKPPADPASSVHPLRVADTCGACHGNAGYMKEYGIPTDQLEKYRRSVHWKTMSEKGDLSAPTCNDCHGNHGASPPGVGWVGNVCGQCHTVMAELFAGSVHAGVFRDMGVPGCAACHENHEILPADDTLLGLDEKAACAACHTRDDAGGRTALEMRALIDRLADRSSAAREILTRAEHAGVEVSQAQFDLNGALDALVKARAAVHAFRLEAVAQAVEAGLAIADTAQARGQRALDELRFRRTGLGVSVVIIAALIGGLLVKIRQLDRRRAPPGVDGEGGDDGRRSR